MTDQSREPAEKKIIIDEDWKSKVESEREQEREQQEPKPAQPASAAEPEDLADGPLPPPTLAILATTLGMQAMAALGLAPDPMTGKVQTRLHQARHLIDMLQMLQDKTQGNRTDEETAVLDHLLHELRMGYVAKSRG